VCGSGALQAARTVIAAVMEAFYGSGSVNNNKKSLKEDITCLRRLDELAHAFCKAENKADRQLILNKGQQLENLDIQEQVTSDVFNSNAY
jgi:hypothetical protein